MLHWMVAAIAFFIGIVFTLGMMAAGLYEGIAQSPGALGALLGTFLAAFIGLAAALVVHLREQAERKRQANAALRRDNITRVGLLTYTRHILIVVKDYATNVREERQTPDTMVPDLQRLDDLSREISAFDADLSSYVHATSDSVRRAVAEYGGKWQTGTPEARDKHRARVKTPLNKALEYSKESTAAIDKHFDRLEAEDIPVPERLV